MTRAALLNGLRLIIALVVMLSAVPSLRAAPSMHGVGPPAVADSLLPASLLDHAGHGHSHDHDDPEPSSGHGPEFKDHSHVTLGLAAAPASLIAPDGTFLRLQERCRDPAGLSCRLERPPRPLSAL